MRERQKALEEMGISIHKAGVAIDRNRFYLVNLNEDPAMSEMLVYYLKVSFAMHAFLVLLISE